MRFKKLMDTSYDKERAPVSAEGIANMNKLNKVFITHI